MSSTCNNNWNISYNNDNSLEKKHFSLDIYFMLLIKKLKIKLYLTNSIMLKVLGG